MKFRANINESKWHVLGGVYLHGHLEDYFGFDVVEVYPDTLKEFEKSEPTCYEGVEVEVEDYGTCLLYAWVASYPYDREKHRFWRGLIVDPKDTESVEYAKEKFEEKSAVL